MAFHEQAEIDWVIREIVAVIDGGPGIPERLDQLQDGPDLVLQNRRQPRMHDGLCEEYFRSLEIAMKAFRICPEKPEVFRKNVPCGTIFGKDPEHKLGVLLIDTYPQFIANPQGGCRIGQDHPVFEGNQKLTG